MVSILLSLSFPLCLIQGIPVRTEKQSPRGGAVVSPQISPDCFASGAKSEIRTDGLNRSVCATVAAPRHDDHITRAMSNQSPFLVMRTIDRKGRVIGKNQKNPPKCCRNRVPVHCNNGCCHERLRKARVFACAAGDSMVCFMITGQNPAAQCERARERAPTSDRSRPTCAFSLRRDWS